MKKKNGKFKTLYDTQIMFQNYITSIPHLPADDIKWNNYHMLALSEEIGELLKADKRWKTHRNEHFDPENKLEEIADCLITLMNVSIFSGFESSDVLDAVENKIKTNFTKLELKERREINE